MVLKLVTAAEMRAIEGQAVARGATVDQLMERAGLAVARRVKQFLSGAAGKRVLVLVGPGNNGGDGLVAARHLQDWGAKVHLYLCSPHPAQDPNFLATQQRRIPWSVAEEDGEQKGLDYLLNRCDAVLDALLGTGKTRPLEGVFRETLLRVSQAKVTRPELRLIALDLPSGLDSDTGAAGPATPAADLTITLGFPKRGLYAFPGATRAGRVEVVDIGLPAGDDTTTGLLTDSWAASALPSRHAQAHKGSFGRVLAIAGSLNYIGAAQLACLGAYRVGAGLVTLSAPRSLHPILAGKLTEVTHLPLPEGEPGFLSPVALTSLSEALPQYQVVLVGCGLGQRPETEEFLRSLLPLVSSQATVWDADALNLLSLLPNWHELLPRGAILTPHPAEMARLSGIDIEEGQQHRLKWAGEMSRHWGQVVVLKGAFTVIASPQGLTWVAPFANPALSSAGTGDVLAGAIAGLLAQGLTAFAAAACGVYLHGLAGAWVRAQMGDAGAVASDLLTALPQVIRRLKEGTDAH